MCEKSVCVLPKKTCAQDCSGHGQCKYRDASTGAGVLSCKLGELSCTSYCECQASYSGLTCSLTAEEMQAKQTAREQLLQGLQNITTTEDTSTESVSSLISNLGALTSSPDEISISAIGVVNSILDHVVSNMLDVRVSMSDKLSVAGTLDKFMQAQDIQRQTKPSSRSKSNPVAAARSRLNLQDSASVDIAASETNVTTYPASVLTARDLVDKYGKSIASDMVLSEPPIHISKTQFRMTTALLDSSKPLQDVNIQIPQSSSEILMKKPSPRYN